jgi:hypothetical protein
MPFSKTVNFFCIAVAGHLPRRPVKLLTQAISARV